MDKRTFLKSLGLVATGIPALSFAQEDFFETPADQKKLLAQVLRRGDTIGLIAPAGVIDTEESIFMTREIFEKFGFKVKEGKHEGKRRIHKFRTDHIEIELEENITFNVDGEKITGKKFIVNVIPKAIWYYNDDEFVREIIE